MTTASVRPRRAPRRSGTERAGLRPTLARILGIGALTLVVSSCGFLSKDGPYDIQVRQSAEVDVPTTTPNIAYATVSLSPPSLDAANASTLARSPAFPPLRGGVSDVRIGVGDVASITVFEAAGGGLFLPPDQSGSSRQGNFVALPSQQVDSEGRVVVPYAGSVRVLGLTPEAASKEIARRLANRAVEPQVVLAVTDRRAGGISVLGDVNSPTRLQVEPGGIRILEAIARAGGPKDAPYETIVSLKRGARTYQAAMGSLVRIPGQNVQLASGDVVYLSKEQKIFLVLGATPAPGSIGGTNNRRFSFDSDNMTMAEAVAKAGGLDAARANPQAVFLYRLEPRPVLEKLGVDTSRFAGNEIPTIYTVDMSRGDSFFLFNGFYMRDRDIVFVAEAPVVDLQRFTNALSGLTGNASSVANIR